MCGGQFGIGGMQVNPTPIPSPTGTTVQDKFLDEILSKTA